MALRKVLGADILNSKNTSTGVGKSPVGDDVAVSTLEGKTLLLYFSASWCPPCKQFTPLLVKFYREQKEKAKKKAAEEAEGATAESSSAKEAKDFEVVWISADRSKDEFEGYYKEMPWLTLPWGAEKEMKHREKLGKKFKVSGIPTLVVIDKDGKTVTTKGKDYVLKDKEGEKFPWIPRQIYEVLAEAKITSQSGMKMTVEDLKKLDGGFALYFSAHWCPPCRSFTPRLVSTYTKLKRAAAAAEAATPVAGAGGEGAMIVKNKKTAKNIEIIFVSSDREESGYKEYLEEMPWAAVAFSDARIKELKEICEVSSIPSLVTVSASEGVIINKEARSLAADDPEGNDWPWKSNALLTCNPFVPSDPVVNAVNTEICVILSANDASNKETFKIEFAAAAEKYKEMREGGIENAAVVQEGTDDEASTVAEVAGATTTTTTTLALKGATTEDETPVYFFIVDSPDGSDLYARVLAAVGAGSVQAGVATVMSINLGNDRAKARMSGEISVQNILDHVTSFKKAQEIKDE